MKSYKYKTEYVHGYLPKIKYWSYQVFLATEMSPLSHIEHCTNNLTYFLNKQKEWEYLQEAKADSDMAIMKDEGLI